MPMILLSRIVEGGNARETAAAPESDEGLRASIATVGMLQPLLLRPAPGAGAVPTDHDSGDHALEIVLGGRRLRAARALGLDHVPAEIRPMSDRDVEIAQIAENLQRADMHPVDLCRGLHGLIQDHGLSFEEAAAGLGLDHRVIRRLEMLGRLDPAFRALARIQMPAERHLRVIAAAPQKLQAQVARDKGLVVMTGAREIVDWARVTERCTLRRIPRVTAIFDWTAVDGLVWDEDLFAEPGSDEQFTTADADGFVKHQTAALRARVAERVKAKQRHQVATMKDTWSVALPNGFAAVFGGDPEKPRRHETVFHAVAPDGTVKVAVGLDKKAASETASRKKARALQPGTAPADATAPASAEAGADDVDTDDDEEAATPEEKARPPFTQKGQAFLALAKGEAIRDALERPTPVFAALNLLILALCCDNVTVTAAGRRVRFDDLATRMLQPGGNLIDLSAADRSAIATAAIGRIINLIGPAAVTYNPDSGAAAEWIGAAIDAAQCLPRFDTEAFLATAALTELRRAATGAGLLATGTATALRERLKGRAPDYRPESAVFGAPAPKVRADA